LRERGDYSGADERLKRSLAAKSDYAEAIFELGRTALKEGEVLRARELFAKLVKKESSPRSAAYMAYCFNLQGKPGAAIPWYEKAIEWRGDAPELYNNLAFSLDIGQSRYSERDEAARARASLRRAFEQLPKSATIRLNMTCNAIHCAEKFGEPISREMEEVCRTLANEFPKCAYVQRKAAQLFALLPERLDEGGLFLRQAIEAGGGPKGQELSLSKRWAAYRALPSFQQMVEEADSKSNERTSEPAVSRLLEPTSLAMLPK
jgi:tetratricopeptide (TPR) repeat protein